MINYLHILIISFFLFGKGNIDVPIDFFEPEIIESDSQKFNSQDTNFGQGGSGSREKSPRIIEDFILTKNIAQNYKDLGLNIKAIEYIKKAEQVLYNQKDLSLALKAKYYNELSDFYYSISDNKSYKRNLIKATELWESDKKSYLLELTESYNGLIKNYLEYGDVNNANWCLSKLKTLSNLNYPEGHSVKYNLSVLLNELSLSLHESDLEKSKVKFVELQQYFSKVRDKKPVLSFYADATNFYSEAIFKQGKTTAALQLLEESIVIHREIQHVESLVYTLSYYSYLKRLDKDFRVAHNAIDEAIELTDKDNLIDLSGLYISKGIILFDQGNFTESSAHFDKANRLINEIKNSNFYLLSYNCEISKKYLEIYQNTRNDYFLYKSLASYRVSVNLFLDFYENNFFNPLLYDHKNLITDGLFEIGILSKKNQIEIINMIESIQSKFLLKNFLLNNLPLETKSANDLEEINSLKLRLSRISKDISNKDADPFAGLEIKNKIDFLEYSVLKKNPNFKAILNPTFNFKEFLSSNNTPTIRYYKTDKNLFAIYIDGKKRIAFERLGDAGTINQNVETLLEKVKQKGSVNQLSKQLYNELLEPFSLKDQDLTIIANCFLNELPFEILIDKNNKFLVESHRINYALSFSLYHFQRKINTKNELNIGIFQPSYNDKIFSKLSFASKEAHFLKENYKAKLYAQSEATKGNFIKNADKFNVYHLAMHAKMDEVNEDASKLLFEDENLYFSDLYALKLPLDLVVLSACETGLGKNILGEGLMSLSRAFTYSGVAATIHSLWEIPDKQAYEIMKHFYRNVGQGQSKSEALQQAKIGFLNSAKAEELKHPYYWSGFVLNGNAEPLFLRPYYKRYAYITFTFFALSILVFLKFRK